jgi:uncharacterized membrane protein YecN with MAPEG domain
MLLLELCGTSSTALVALGIAIVVARGAHAARIVLRSRHPLHFAGAALTYALEVVLACMLFATFVRRAGS